MAEHPGRILASKVINPPEVVNIVDCTDCGYIHAHPFPDEAALRQYYGHAFFGPERWPQYLDKAEYERDYWLVTYRKRIKRAQKHILCDVGALLDIGSGPGLSLEAGQQMDYRVHGIEPGDQAVAHIQARGYASVLHHGTFNDYQGPAGFFEIVTMYFLLEHVLDPQAVLAKAYDLLAPGGVLIIEVPRDYTKIQAAMERVVPNEGWWVALWDHRNYFSRDSLGKLVRRCGYETVDCTATMPMEFYLAEGENYLGNPQIGSTCHRRRMNFELNLHKYLPGFLDQYYDFLDSHDIGREIILYVRKPLLPATRLMV